LMGEGCEFLRKRGLATAGDLEHTEAHGCLAGAEPERISPRALQRGANQCGTLGAGNHFLEVQVVDAIFDDNAARVMGLEKDMVCVMIHSGSRGLGYQVCDDALRSLRNVPRKYGIELPDRQLVCAPVESVEGERYLGSMRAAANFAWCNRQLLMWQAREVFETVFGRTWTDMEMNVIYDVAHNIAKIEEHVVDGKRMKLCIHRKGATRAFGPGHPAVTPVYRDVGQPVLVPGDMGTASYLLVGTQAAMRESFGSTCHGAGRLMSRHAAKKAAKGHNVTAELAEMGVTVKGAGRATLIEEIPQAYKDVEDVVRVVHEAGIARKVARLRPLGVIKG